MCYLDDPVRNQSPPHWPNIKCNSKPASPRTPSPDEPHILRCGVWNSPSTQGQEVMVLLRGVSRYHKWPVSCKRLAEIMLCVPPYHDWTPPMLLWFRLLFVPHCPVEYTGQLARHVLPCLIYCSGKLTWNTFHTLKKQQWPESETLRSRHLFLPFVSHQQVQWIWLRWWHSARGWLLHSVSFLFPTLFSILMSFLLFFFGADPCECCCCPAAPTSL